MHEKVVRRFAAVALLLGTCLSCAFAIFHFYDLYGRTLVLFKSSAEQNIEIVRTALIGTIASSWAIWLGVGRAHSFRGAALRSGLGTLVSFAFYGFAGCGGVLGGDFKMAGLHGSTDFLFPSAFFSEFSFLTFIFEVAPSVAIAQIPLIYLCTRFMPPEDASIPSI